MKKFIKFITFGAAMALSLSLFAACTPEQTPTASYDTGVVQAFRTVTPAGDLVSQTAVAEGQNYLVTVITSTSVAEYSLDAAFRVEEKRDIVGTSALSSLAEVGSADAPLSDLERAYNEALTLSGIPKSEVIGFDFDFDTYLGEQVFKVEIEDRVAEYSYIFRAADLTLIASEIELKTGTATGETSYIGAERAKAIALEAAAIEAQSAADLTVKDVLQSGRKVYKVGFSYEGFRYDVEIDALSGDILKFAKTVLDESVKAPEVPSVLSEERIKELAVAFAFPEGAEGHAITFRKVKLDYEKGAFVYEVEFLADGNEYELELLASDGSVLDFEIEPAEADDDRLPAEGFLTREQAVEKARALAGADAFLLDVEIEKRMQNGTMHYYYEVELRVGNREVEYVVDAVTGEVTLNEEYAGNPATPALSEEEALAIAMESFQLTEGEIDVKKIKLEREDGRLVYEIKFYCGSTEYSIELDAQSGKILEREIEEEDDLPPQPGQGQTGAMLTLEQARAALQSVVGANARIEEIELEGEGRGENRRYFYEAEVVIGGREYEYVVDAYTGAVSLKGEYLQNGRELIGEEQAVEIALRYFSLTAGEARVAKVKLEEDDGILQYEVKLRVGNMEYTLELDAETGRVLEHDISFD